MTRNIYLAVFISLLFSFVNAKAQNNPRLSPQQAAVVEQVKKDLIRWQPCFLRDFPANERSQRLEEALSNLDPVLVGKYVVLSKRWLTYIGNDRNRFPVTRAEFTRWVNLLDELYECYEEFVGHRPRGNGIIFIGIAKLV
jgi:predicted ATPase